ncbi:Csu type fimbrial protein [Erwinia sorbitola]|uniref:Fimbrial major subunit CsuA/B family protein n=2 Tax=Erwinia sorbitola TaxID=2681984 RepID=A0A6I6EI79_9GAMM|nr:fimbrial major subunit CsuA/B family protein [Erwinia sorbitola]QGU89607.1 fimbrial major subunit CsuA/B family protein [Erwinia sorbitola]
MRPLFLLLLVYSSSGSALPTANFAVNASVVNGCVISGTNTAVFGTLDFGTQPGVGSATANAAYVQSSSIVLACTPGTALSMRIDGGSNYTNTRNLKLAGNTNLVAYSLYTNAAHTTAIPVGQDMALTLSNANNITLPVYGQLQLSGVNRAGNYSDTLTVTLSW